MKNPYVSTTYQRLTLAHLVHLRTVAEGLDPVESATRHLGAESAHEALLAHQLAVARARGAARKAGLRGYRLIGLTIRERKNRQPTLDEFIAERGLEDWSESEVLEMFAEAHPPDRRAARRTRLRELQLAAIAAIEPLASAAADAGDLVADWFMDHQTERLNTLGVHTLGELAAYIVREPRWYSTIPGWGETKAAQAEQLLRAVLPAWVWPMPLRLSPALQALPPRPLPPHQAASQPMALESLPAPPSAEAAVLSDPPPLDAAEVAAAHARAAALIEDWIRAKAGSLETARRYRREAQRLLLWADQVMTKTLFTLTPEDCLAYLAFLASPPDTYVGNTRAPRFTEKWKPFARRLSVDSRQQIVGILSAFYRWLRAEGEISKSPWNRINSKLGDDVSKSQLQSRAVPDAVLAELVEDLDHRLAALAACSGKRAELQRFTLARTRFLVQFLRHTGLRSSEVLAATVGALEMKDARLYLRVKGKGKKVRTVPIVGPARQALEDWATSSGLFASVAVESLSLTRLLADQEKFDAVASRHVVCAEDGSAITYSSLYRSLTRALKAAARGPDASEPLRQAATQVSPHWLRHACGTALVEAGIPLEAVGDLFGHSDPKTTKRYTRTRPERLADFMEQLDGSAVP